LHSCSKVLRIYCSVYLLYWYKSINTEKSRISEVQASLLLSLLALLVQKHHYWEVSDLRGSGEVYACTAARRFSVYWVYCSVYLLYLYESTKTDLSLVYLLLLVQKDQYWHTWLSPRP
jgi:hypothetical protein